MVVNFKVKAIVNGYFNEFIMSCDIYSIQVSLSDYGVYDAQDIISIERCV